MERDRPLPTEVTDFARKLDEALPTGQALDKIQAERALRRLGEEEARFDPTEILKTLEGDRDVTSLEDFKRRRPELFSSGPEEYRQIMRRLAAEQAKVRDDQMRVVRELERPEFDAFTDLGVSDMDELEKRLAEGTPTEAMERAVEQMTSGPEEYESLMRSLQGLDDIEPDDVLKKKTPLGALHDLHRPVPSATEALHELHREHDSPFASLAGVDAPPESARSTRPLWKPPGAS